MTETSLLAPWANFYIMTGSAAASLIGLMFVVITLVTGEERALKNPDGIAAFSTPTVLHFSTALMVSATCSAPWPSFAGPVALVGVIGLGGVFYIVRAFSLARRLPTYQPDFEDWSFYTVLPLIAYGVLVASALALHFGLMGALFGYGGGIIMLIFIGIHNAWDIVTYLAMGGADALKPPPQ